MLKITTQHLKNKQKKNNRTLPTNSLRLVLMILSHSRVKLLSKSVISPQMITRWAFLGLISTNRDGPLHSTAETITSPPPSPSFPSRSLSPLSLSLSPLSLAPSSIDHPQMSTGEAKEMSLHHVILCPLFFFIIITAAIPGIHAERPCNVAAM